MKKLIILMLIVLSAQTYAQMFRNLVVTSQHGTPFYLYVNDRPVNPQALPGVKVSGLTENYYDIAIKLNYSQRLFRTRLYVPPFSEIIYSFILPTSPGQDIAFEISDIYPTEENQGNYTQIPSFSINLPDIQPDVPVIQDMPEEPVDDIKYQNILHILDNQSFEDTKLSSAKNIIMDNILSVNQLAGILDLFSFDENKLKLAKFAYDYIYDPENYYLLSDHLTFDSNKQDLNRFIMSKH